MQEEKIKRYIEQFNELLEIPNNKQDITILELPLASDKLKCYQSEFERRFFANGNLHNDSKNVLSSVAMILYGFRLGAVLNSGRFECITRQSGFEDKAVFPFNLNEYLNIQDSDEVEKAVESIIHWIINPESNKDITATVFNKMVGNIVKLLCRSIPPNKLHSCTVIFPPYSVDLEPPSWNEILSDTGISSDVSIKFADYGELLTLSDSERSYICFTYTGEEQEYIIISAYEVIRGQNACVGSLAFDITDNESFYVLRNNKTETVILTAQDHIFTKKKKAETVERSWEYVACKLGRIPGFYSFCGQHGPRFAENKYLLTDQNDSEIPDSIRDAFIDKKVLDIFGICSLIMHEQYAQKISLGDMVYIADIIEKNPVFKNVDLYTGKDIGLGTKSTFPDSLSSAKYESIPSNYYDFKWKLKSNNIKLIPYFDLSVKKHSTKQIFESIIAYYDHCTTDKVASDYLYLAGIKEEPTIYFTVKVFGYLSSMKSIEVESKNMVISIPDDVSNITYSPLDRSKIVFKGSGSNEKKSAVQREKTALKQVKNISLDELDLSVRTYNLLKRAGYNTIGDLYGKSYEDFARIKNMGNKGLLELQEKVAKYKIRIIP